MEIKDQTLVLLVNNKPDLLARITGILSGRGYNIENICANITAKTDTTKITMVVKGNTATTKKLDKQLCKLVDVLSVSHLNEEQSVQREMVLINMKITDQNKNAIMESIENFGCKIIKMEGDHCILEITGEKSEIEQVLNHMISLGLKDLSRSGIVAI